ncbi:MAG: hypothetical protein H0U61_14705 [Nocardioidaceae bacterium]|nr:hypothetical protein [Nocardioidaceae bacterium]
MAKPRTPVRLHLWVEGTPVADGPSSSALTRWAGHTLASLHSLRVQPAEREMFPVTDACTAARWPELTERADRAHVPWAGLMHEAAGAVKTAVLLFEAGEDDADEQLMTHGDIDQKNLLIGPVGPVLCDWDVATPLVPRRELAEVALSLAGWTRFDLAREVVAAYRDTGGRDISFRPADLGRSLMIGLDWTAFNVNRALGVVDTTPAERASRARLVPRLVRDIRRHVNVAARVDEALNFSCGRLARLGCSVPK